MTTETATSPRHVAFPPTTAVAAPSFRPRRRMRRALKAWIFMIPLAVVSLLVVTAPAIMSVYYSLTSWTGIGAAKFIGLANYRRLLGDHAFLVALEHNLSWTVSFLVVPMIMALAGAYLLSRLRRFVTAFRVLYFIPYVVSSVVGASIWQSLLSPVGGFAQLVHVNLLGNTHTALFAIEGINTWARWGFLVIVFSAAMQQVDMALYEAATLDGANSWQQFWHVTLPAIRPTTVFMGIMIVIWSFLVFDWVYVLTEGGPANSTDVLSILLWNDAFQSQEAGYAAAIGVVLGLISGLVVAAYLILRKTLDWDV